MGACGVYDNTKSGKCCPGGGILTLKMCILDSWRIVDNPHGILTGKTISRLIL